MLCQNLCLSDNNNRIISPNIQDVAEENMYFRCYSEWGDVESDTDSDHAQHLSEPDESPRSSTSLQQPSLQKQGSLHQKQTEQKRLERRRLNQSQRMQQIKQLDQLPSSLQHVWIFIYDNKQQGLVECVEGIDGEKEKSGGGIGWEVRLERERARELIRDGFRKKRVFVTIQLGNRNYVEGRKYAGRGSEKNKQEDMAKSQYTFQKKKKQLGDNNRLSKKQSQRSDRDKESSISSYKNDPLYQNLGDFRTKDPLKKSVSYMQSPQKLDNDLKYVEFTKKVSYREMDKEKEKEKPKYVQKMSKRKYKEKAQTYEQLVQQTPIENTTQKQKVVQQVQKEKCVKVQQIICETHYNQQHSETKQDSLLQSLQQHVQRKEESFTKESSSISQGQVVGEHPQNTRSENEEDEQQEQEKGKKVEEQKPKKKKRNKKNKDKVVKVKPVSNNPFSVLG